MPPAEPIVPAGKKSWYALPFLDKLSNPSWLGVVVFAVTFAVIGSYFLFKGSAQGSAVATLQAETMTLPQYSKVVTGSAASGGKFVRMNEPGSLQKNITLGSTVSSITVIAKGESCRGSLPKMVLNVDGKNLLSTIVANTSWSSFSADVSLAAGSHAVKVTYAGATKTCIPTLYVDVLTFFGSGATTPPPTVSLTASPTAVTSGQTATLTWSSLNATSCTAGGAWSGTQSTAGTYTTPALTGNSSYTLSCSGAGGTTTAKADVTVTATTPPPASGMWKPTADKPISLHWVLGGALDVNDPVQMGLRDFNGNVLPEPDVYDIDGEYNTKATVDYLHSKGKKVICYFDAGVYETYRSDAYKFQALSPKIWGNADEGWDGSYWLDIRRVSDLESIMKARIQMCKEKGFDSIEPDEITNWSNNPGFPITYQDQIVYNRAIAKWAHEAGLSIGLKGDLEQAHDLVGDFDWTLNEECYQYSECTTINNSGGPGADGKDYPGLQLFVQANKAVWIAEYKNFDATKWNSICTDSAKNHFNTTLFKLGLPNNGGRKPCTPTW